MPRTPKSGQQTPDPSVSAAMRATVRRSTASAGRVKPTIRSVAERAGVAVSTVSRVLNGGYASADSRERVEAAIKELGYAPSITAQSLVTGRAGCIGVVTYTSQTTWFSQILSGVEEELADSRQSVLLSTLMINGRYDASAAASWIEEGRVDGIIFVRYTPRELSLFEAAVDANMPVVLIGPDVKAPAQSVIRCNNVEAGRQVGRHLLGFNHRSVAFAGGPRESIDTRDRLEGLREVYREQGVELSEDRVWFGPHYAAEAGAEYAEAFLAMVPAKRPTAVVLGNDAMAMGFLRGVLSHDIKVPQEVSVVGFDGIPEGALYWPGLTSVVQPAHLMGASGCRALLACLSNDPPDKPQELECEVTLIARESTGPARES